MTQLHRLVYHSRNRIARGDVGAEIRAVLEASRRNNADVGVTGALMFNSGCFGQVLEGKREVLESTFERIQRDDRHGEVSVLAFEPIAERMFGQWSMAYLGASAKDRAAYEDVSAAGEFDPSRATGDEMVDALRALALEEERA